MAYDRRDIIGHWIRRDQRTNRMCTHPCCRGYRVHPKNMPVILPNRLLREAPERDLVAHRQRLSQQEQTPKVEAAQMQILWEIDRREAEQRRRDRRAQERLERRAEAEQRRRDRYSATRAADRMEREAVAELAYLQAEAGTRGNLLNRQGQAAGIDPRSLFTGPQARARKYASHELLEHWQTHPRPTAAHWQGADTRVYELYTAPKRRDRRGRRAA